MSQADIKRRIFLAALNFGAMSVGHLEKLVAELRTYYQEEHPANLNEIKNTIEEINEDVKEDNMRLSFFLHSLVNEEFLVFAFTKEADSVKSRNKLENLYFGLLVEALATVNNYSIPCSQAYRLLTATTDSDSSEVEIPGAGPVVVGLLEAGLPEAGPPDAGLLEAGLPEAAPPEAGPPAVVPPEPNLPESDSDSLESDASGSDSSGSESPREITEELLEEITDDFIEQGYFIRLEDMLHFGPRLLVELKDVLKYKFGDRLKECSLCRALALWDIQCSHCRMPVHRPCIRMYLARESDCPSCHKLWEVPLQ